LPYFLVVGHPQLPPRRVLIIHAVVSQLGALETPNLLFESFATAQSLTTNRQHD
jgi:hypothetical protein